MQDTGSDSPLHWFSLNIMCRIEHWFVKDSKGIRVASEISDKYDKATGMQAILGKVEGMFSMEER